MFSQHFSVHPNSKIASFHISHMAPFWIPSLIIILYAIYIYVYMFNLYVNKYV